MPDIFWAFRRIGYPEETLRRVDSEVEVRGIWLKNAGQARLVLVAALMNLVAAAGIRNPGDRFFGDSEERAITIASDIKNYPLKLLIPNNSKKPTAVITKDAFALNVQYIWVRVLTQI